VYVTHPIDADLTVSLVGPDGNSVPLSVHRGGSGDDFGTSCGSRTGFDDSAAPPISAGVAPFSGTFQPDSPLSAFDRRNQKGTWRLRIDNSQGSERGILNCWGIRITN
jgi:subtilisin-like proprotein convertase family protein